VKDVVLAVKDTTLPGPDCCNARFFKMHQGRYKEKLLSMVQDAFEIGKIIESINHTTLSLIPKHLRPKRTLVFDL